MHKNSLASARTPVRAHHGLATLVAVTMLSAAGLNGCVPIAGTLDVRAPVELAVTELFEDERNCAIADFDADCKRDETRKQTVLHTGRYKASLDMSNRSALTLSLTERNKARREIRFSLPHDLRVPEKQGRFSLLEPELGQPVDVRGSVSTRSTHSNIRREYEFCSYTVERWVCRDRRHGARPDGKARAHRSSMHFGNQKQPATSELEDLFSKPDHHAHRPHRRHRSACGWRTVKVQGNRKVEFFLEYETRTVALDLLRPRTKEQVARFEGTQTETHKRYQRPGACL